MRSEMGLGCVKTSRHLIAIEGNIRPSPLWSPCLQANLNLETELKNIILVAFGFFEFSHSRGQKRKSRTCGGTSASPRTRTLDGLSRRSV